MDEWISMHEYEAFYKNKDYEIIESLKIGEEIYVKMRKEVAYVQPEDKRETRKEIVLPENELCKHWNKKTHDRNGE